MLGLMLVEFMSFYGDHFEKYGFSVRQGGFSFDILATGAPVHPQVIYLSMPPRVTVNTGGPSHVN